jgi:hypothetical protein
VVNKDCGTARRYHALRIDAEMVGHGVDMTSKAQNTKHKSQDEADH